VKEFLLVFVPIFVAIDALGMVPLFLSLTRSATSAQRRRLIGQAVLAALALGATMILVGKGLFGFLGITISDFQIAGGLILLVISVKDLASSTDSDAKIPYDLEHIGIVPLGIPLILGPAALTALLILADSHGFGLTFLSLVLNLALVYVIFRLAPRIEKVLTKNGAAAIAKVASLFLAAIAVMMIRKGITQSFGIGG
jgi:multiple antibiotic resistance protein